jgi:hypothetical protein
MDNRRHNREDDNRQKIGITPFQCTTSIIIVRSHEKFPSDPLMRPCRGGGDTHVLSPQPLGRNTARLVAIENAPATPVNMNVANPIMSVWALIRYGFSEKLIISDIACDAPTQNP